MNARRRTVALLAAVLLPGGLLVGCGGEEDPEVPGSFVVTDLGGESEAPTSTPSARPTSTPTSRPTRTGKPTTRPSEPTRTPDGQPRKATKGDVIAQVGAAITPLNSVHLDITDAAGSDRVVMDIGYGSGAVDLRVPAGATGGAEGIQVRRVNGTLYVDVGGGQGWERVEAGDPRLVGDTGVLAQVLAFDLLDDLRATFVDGTEFEVLGSGDLNGTVVDLYRLSLDASALNQPSLLLDGTTGTLTVEVAIAQDGRPVQLDLAGGDVVSSLKFSAWGAPVAVPVPALD